MNAEVAKGMMTAQEERDLNNYINHSRDIGNFESFVKEKRRMQGRLYRGIRLHDSEIGIGKHIKHFEPLLSCSEDLEVSEIFALNGYIPEDIVNSFVVQLDRDLDLDWELTHDEFVSVVLEIEEAMGVRVLDYLSENYDYASEKEVVLLNETFEIISIEPAFTTFGEPYYFIQVQTVKTKRPTK